MKKLFALVLALVTLVCCCTAAFAVTHYGNDSTTQQSQEEGAFFLLNNTGNVVGAIRLDEFTAQIKSGSSPVALNVGYQSIADILSEGKLLRCKNYKVVTLSDDKSTITAGESYITATWEIMNQAVIDSLGISSLAELVENTKFALTINGKDLAGHRFLDKDAGTEVARLHLGKNYISVRYADWADGIENNFVLCFRAGAKPYTGSNNNSHATATPAPQQPTVTPPTVTPVPQQPTATPPTVTPVPQQPANTPAPEYQPVVTPPTLSGNNNTGSTGNSGSSNNNSGNSGNVPNPEYQPGTLPGNLGDFWN